MERMTYRENDIVYIKIDGDLIAPVNMSSFDARKALERLADYEDAAEQQEKGCGWCNKWATKPKNWECTVLKDDGSTMTTPGDFAMSTEAYYCPVCSRKLV